VSEPGLADPAIEELLRYTTPVEMTLPRIAREDVTLASVTIPRGEWVSGVLGSANRDETVFKDPETLDLARDPNPHVALGQGRHFCLGASLARLEAQIALPPLSRDEEQSISSMHLTRSARAMDAHRVISVSCGGEGGWRRAIE
jgi:cytochrome P450